MRELLVTNQFRRDLRVLPASVKREVDFIVELLLTNPLDPLFDIKKLHGVRLRLWRVRIGNYRLLYSFTFRQLMAHRICHRREVYLGL
ncbi:MAG: type II toxin-antitoxin system RelE/ParE family toxin [bacterium]